MSAILDTLMSIARNSGFVGLAQEPGYLAMIVVACILLYLAIVKEFEPLLLLPIAFGMLLANLPGSGISISLPPPMRQTRPFTRCSMRFCITAAWAICCTWA